MIYAVIILAFLVGLLAGYIAGDAAAVDLSSKDKKS